MNKGILVIMALLALSVISFAATGTDKSATEYRWNRIIMTAEMYVKQIEQQDREFESMPAIKANIEDMKGLLAKFNSETSRKNQQMLINQFIAEVKETRHLLTQIDNKYNDLRLQPDAVQ